MESTTSEPSLEELTLLFDLLARIRSGERRTTTHGNCHWNFGTDHAYLSRTVFPREFGLITLCCERALSPFFPGSACWRLRLRAS